MSNRKIVVVNYYDENEDVMGQYTGLRANRTKNYEYLAPEGATGNEKFAVVCVSSKISQKKDGLKIVKIVEFRELTTQQFEGDLKSVVAVLDTDAFERDETRRAEKKALLSKIEKKLSERTKITQLEALIGDDEEAAALLAAYKAL